MKGAADNEGMWEVLEVTESKRRKRTVRLNDWQTLTLESQQVGDGGWNWSVQEDKIKEEELFSVFVCCKSPFGYFRDSHMVKKICGTFRGEDMQPARSLANRVSVFKLSWRNHTA